MKETETSSATPEQLLQIVDVQIAMTRARRKASHRNRALFLTIGIVCILGGAAVALVVLSQMLQEMPRSNHLVSEVHGSGNR